MQVKCCFSEGLIWCSPPLILKDFSSLSAQKQHTQSILIEIKLLPKTYPILSQSRTVYTLFADQWSKLLLSHSSDWLFCTHSSWTFPEKQFYISFFSPAYWLVRQHSWRTNKIVFSWWSTYCFLLMLTWEHEEISLKFFSNTTDLVSGLMRLTSNLPT